jgi:prepilin-type N-terminal cleavage/methylation domain-containing protein
MINKNQKTKGFTLVETLVSLLIFGFISIILVNVFVSVLNSQKRILQNQELMNSSSYVLDYMAKLVRMANSDETGNCTGTVGKSYILTAAVDSITFLAYDTKSSSYKCTQFLLNGTTIEERKSTNDDIDNLGTAQTITSSSVQVTGLTFGLTGDGADTLQPKVTIMIKMKSTSLSANAPSLIVQTSVSQRKLDI